MVVSEGLVGRIMEKINYRINVTKPYLPDKTRFDDLTNEIWDNHWLTNDGPLLTKFQSRLREYLGCSHISTTTNGHSALDVAVKALELSGEVITTPFSFASTSHSIALNGITPVFCDIDPETYTLNPENIESLITEKTTAICLCMSTVTHATSMELKKSQKNMI